MALKGESLPMPNPSKTISTARCAFSQGLFLEGSPMCKGVKETKIPRSCVGAPGDISFESIQSREGYVRSRFRGAWGAPPRRLLTRTVSCLRGL